jgi:hypothetical protein
VAAIAFDSRGDMGFGFTDGHCTVMTTAAITKNFKVVNRTDKVKAESGMTGLTNISGCGVRSKFGQNRINRTGTLCITAIMTLCT